MRRNCIFFSRYAPLFPAIFFIVAYLLPLGGRIMIRPDEFRYAEIPREMLATGAWMNPRLNGVKYFEKPTLGYQLIALSMRAFGENPFALRLPSALGTLLAALMIYLVCRRERLGRFWASVATGLYFVTGLVYGIGTFAVLDAPFSAAVTVSIGALYLAYRGEEKGEVVLWLAAAGVAAAVAFMLKGFLALVLPAIVAAPFLIWRREWKKLFALPWLPFLIVLLIAIPWALAQHRAEPDFWSYFFIEEHWKRFTSSTYDRKAQPFWYFIPVLLIGILPAGLLWLVGAWGCTKKWLERRFVQYLLCWAIFPFLLFSASSCKLGTYILPCFPPLTMLLASALKNARRCRCDRYRSALRRLCAIFGCLIFAVGSAAVLVTAATPFLPLKLAGVLFPVLVNPWSILTVVSLLIFGVVQYRLSRGSDTASLWMFLTGLAPVACFGMLAVPVLWNRTPEQGLRACFSHFPDQPECVIAVERTCIAPTCWVLKRHDLLVAGKKLGELKYGIEKHPREYANRHVPFKEFPELVKRHPGKVLYVTFNNLKEDPLPEYWPAPIECHTRDGVTVMRF